MHLKHTYQLVFNKNINLKFLQSCGKWSPCLKIGKEHQQALFYKDIQIINPQKHALSQQ
jgi:hypothetical protein